MRISRGARGRWPTGRPSPRPSSHCWRLGTALGTLCLVASACSGSPTRAGAGVEKGGVVTFAEQPGSPPTYIFPLYNGANSGNNNITYLQPLLWRPLYWFGHVHSAAATFNARLSLALPPVFSNGGKTVSMRLEHVTWSDGRPVTSRDILFWMNLLRANTDEWGLYAPGDWITHIVSMADPNPRTFSINFNVAYNRTYLLYNGLSEITPLPRFSWDKTCGSCAVGNADMTLAGARAVYTYLNSQSVSLNTWATNPLWQIVDGPWRLEPKIGYETGGRLTFVPNTRYNGPDKPTIAKFIELPFTSATSEYNALLGGEVDYGYVPTVDVPQIPTLRAKGYKILPWAEWGITFIGLNYSNPVYGPLLDQLYLRQALQHLIDEPAYIKAFLYGYGDPTYGPVPVYPPSPFLAPATTRDPDPYSLGATRQLLVSHGWTIPPGGVASCTRPGTGPSQCGSGIERGTVLRLPLLYTSGVPELTLEITELRSVAATVGIQLQVSQAAEGAVLSASYACIGESPAKCPASSTALSLISSPVYTYVPTYYPSGGALFGTGGSTNGGNFSDSRLDALIAQVRTAHSVSSLYAYQELAARLLPVLWFPNADYQISALDAQLGGVTAQDSTGHIYPETWFLRG